MTYSEDPYGANPSFSSKFKGHSNWGAAHPVADGAFYVKYILDISLILTPLSDAFTDNLNSLPTKPDGLTTWVKGTGVEVNGKNFLPLGFRKDTFQSNVDLLYLNNDFLYMGAKPYDGSKTSEAHPPACLDVPLVRLNTSVKGLALSDLKSFIVNKTWLSSAVE